MLIGLCDLHDAIWPESVPEVSDLGRVSERISAHHRSIWNFGDDAENWERLQSPLAILRRVCPEAANWVVDRHEKGKIVWFRDKRSIYYARYDFFQKTLYLHDTLLQRRDGEKAVTLAHEYRHSLQKTSKIIKRTILQILTFRNQEQIMEDEAYDFERQVYLAIFAD